MTTNMRRVGTLTSACTMLALGLLLLFDIVQSSTYFTGGLRFWPVIVIGLGLELLIGWLAIRRKQLAETLRLDGRSLALLFLVGVFSVYFYEEAHRVAAQNVAPPPAQEPLFRVTKKEVSLPMQVTPLAPETRQLLIHNPLGKIEVVGVEGRELRVEAVAHIPSSQTETVSATAAAAKLTPRLSVGEQAVVEVKPERQQDGRADQKKAATPGTVDLRVEVPQGLTVTVKGEFGDVKLSQYQGHAFLSTKTGAIAVDELVGQLTAENTNGPVSARDVEGDVWFRTLQGGVTAQDIRGRVKVFSEAGDCRIQNVSGRLDVTATFGKVELDRISEDVTVNAVSGLLNIKNVKGSLQATAMNGDVAVGGPIEAPWTVTSTNGKVSLEIPKDSSIKFLGETNIGVIRGPTKQSQNTSTKPGAHLTETMGEGSHPVTVRSYNGSIFVDLK